MRYRLFGQTGLRVPEVFLATMVIDDASECRRIIDAYTDAGGNVIDTASAYGDGERMLGSVIDRRDRFVIGTKYTLSRDPGDANASGNHRKNLVQSLEQSLRRLRTDYLDIYWVHIWDRHTPIEETMRGWITPLASGVLSGAADAPAGSPRSRRVDREKLTPRDLAGARAVRTVADELGVLPAQVAIAWTRSKSAAVHPIVGASSATQLTENLGAVDLTLPADAIRHLDAAVEFSPGFPSDFIEECERNPFVFGNAATKVDARATR